MRFKRGMNGAARVEWTAERDGLTLLVVRDKPSRWKIYYWWRLRDSSGRNIAKGNCRDARDGMRRVTNAYRKHAKSSHGERIRKVLP